MEARVVDHFTKVLINQPSEMMNVSSLGGRVAELNKKEKKYLKKIGFNKFLQNHPDNFVVIEDTVVLVHGETPITPKSHPLVPQIPAPPTSVAVENTIQSLRSSPTCSLCLETIEIFAFGVCFHPLCYSCCTKMRFLCDDKHCHICRARLHEVVFTKRLSPMNQLDLSRFVKDGAHGVLFEDQDIKNKQRKLLAHRCLKCRVEMLVFDEFERHVENKHDQYFCSICVKQCKVFTHERERFSRDDLQLHMTSHPMCQFCDRRYLDDDELLYHSQRHHYSCNICSDENHVYYQDADEYWRHAEFEHFVCLHDGCHGNPGFVFVNEVDLKAHKIKEHPGSRDERKKDKILDVNFGSARSTPAPPSGPIYELHEDGSLVCSGVILDGHLRETFGFIKPDAREDFQENIFFNAASCGLDVDDDLRLTWKPRDRVTVHARRAFDEHKSKWRAINVAEFVPTNHDNHYDVIDTNDTVDSFPSLGSASAIPTSSLMPSWSSVARTSNNKLEPNKISKPTQIMKKKQQTGVGKIHENLQPHHGFIKCDANASYEENIYFNIQSYCAGMGIMMSQETLLHHLKPGDKVEYILGDPKSGTQGRNISKYRALQVWKYGHRPKDSQPPSGVIPKQKSYKSTNIGDSNLNQAMSMNSLDNIRKPIQGASRTNKFSLLSDYTDERPPVARQKFNQILSVAAGATGDDVLFEIENEIEIKGDELRIMFVQFTRGQPVQVFLRGSTGVIPLVLESSGFDLRLTSCDLLKEVTKTMFVVRGTMHYVILHHNENKQLEQYTIHYVV